MYEGMLTGRTAMVAGAGRGNGAAIATTLARAGARVAVIDIEADRARTVAEEITASGGEAVAVTADVRVADDVRRIVDEMGAFGGIDVVVCVAGGMYAFHPFRKLVEWSEDVWDDIVERNLRYVFLVCRAAIPVMVEQGRGGSIVLIGSISGMVSSPRHAAYGAAKAGLANLVRSLAVEHGADGIRVNAIAPGAVLTAATSGALTPEVVESYRAQVPLGRPGSPDDVARSVLFLASDLASYVTGQTLIVDGGASVRYPFELPE
jgi:3-oxoacyl-[acyl-carrier protein] reductase